ncbi:uncharacterized protein LOC111399883 [Olea europaea var. sylvestris]|uniref:uncharacterized protein LOC111399883 n=1 Tax=Olea europaea var. sylvestris TaxID=158386 RepID=UPI000C1D499C|nr:uncharacterized protein LOC111399883 [Olea europaea var. sylvestris]
MDRFNRITQDLINCGEKILDEQKVVGLLNVLGDKYKDIRNAPEYGRSDITVEIIHNFLLNRELEFKSEYKEVFNVEGVSPKQRTHVKGVSNFSHSNYHKDKNFIKKKWSNTKEKDKKPSKGKANNKKCFYCGKTRHLIKNYIDKANDQKKYSNTKNASLAIAPNYKEARANIGVAYVSITKNYDQDWVLDSGWSVKLGNDESCQFKGIGNVLLKLQNRHNMLLKHTRYVPALRRNLIS